MYKNQLQEVAQRSCFNLPSYACIREGPDHAPRFKATVTFNGEVFESPHYCSTLRQAEHAAAEVALHALSTRGPSQALAARILDETGVYKNLLQEIAQRAGAALPAYTTIRSCCSGHTPVFTCTVELAGMRFSGEPAKNRKQAEKNAAMAAWSSLRQLPQKLGMVSNTGGDGEINDEQEQITIARAVARHRAQDIALNQHRKQQQLEAGATAKRMHMMQQMMIVQRQRERERERERERQSLCSRMMIAAAAAANTNVAGAMDQSVTTSRLVAVPFHRSSILPERCRALKLDESSSSSSSSSSSFTDRDTDKTRDNNNNRNPVIWARAAEANANLHCLQSVVGVAVGVQGHETQREMESKWPTKDSAKFASATATSTATWSTNSSSSSSSSNNSNSSIWNWNGNGNVAASSSSGGVRTRTTSTLSCMIGAFGATSACSCGCGCASSCCRLGRAPSVQVRTAIPVYATPAPFNNQNNNNSKVHDHGHGEEDVMDEDHTIRLLKELAL